MHLNNHLLVSQMSKTSFLLVPRSQCPLYLFHLVIIALCFLKELEAVKVVALNVPSQVRKGAEVELSCLYELGNASLYSLKWFYRANETDLDEQEFFRYTPSIKPHKQYFPIEGIKVNVNKSQGGRVVIVETNGKTTGKYKCEISIDGTFQTIAAEKLMTVLDFWDFYLPNSIKSHLPGNAESNSASSSLNCSSFLWLIWSLVIGLIGYHSTPTLDWSLFQSKPPALPFIYSKKIGKKIRNISLNHIICNLK